MTQIGTFPSGLAAGQPENVADVVTALNQIKTVVNGNLDAANITTGAGTYDLYKTISTAQALVNSSHTSGNTYFMTVAGSAIVNGQSIASLGFYALALASADYAVTNKTAKLRLRAYVGVNNTAPATTLTLGLYPVTFGGAHPNLTATLGTVVSGSTVAFASPPASTGTVAAGSDFSLPSDGVYAVGITLAGTPAGTSLTWVHAAVQARAV